MKKGEEKTKERDEQEWKKGRGKTEGGKEKTRKRYLEGGKLRRRKREAKTKEERKGRNGREEEAKT